MRVQTIFYLGERCGLRLLYLCLITAPCQLLSDIIFLAIMYCDRVVPLWIIVITCFLRLIKHHINILGNSFDNKVLPTFTEALVFIFASSFSYDANAIDSKVDELVSELEVVEGHGFKPKSDDKNGGISGPLN